MTASQFHADRLANEAAEDGHDFRDAKVAAMACMDWARENESAMVGLAAQSEREIRKGLRKQRRELRKRAMDSLGIPFWVQVAARVIVFMFAPQFLPLLSVALWVVDQWIESMNAQVLTQLAMGA